MEWVYLGGIRVFEGGTFQDEVSTEFCVPSDDDAGLFPTKSPTMVPTRDSNQTYPQLPSMKPSHPSLLPSLSPNIVPMEPPSSDFVTQCGDEPNFRFRNIENWNCEWVKKRKRRKH
jgi:hypothetical protein